MTDVSALKEALKPQLQSFLQGGQMYLTLNRRKHGEASNFLTGQQRCYELHLQVGKTAVLGYLSLPLFSVTRGLPRMPRSSCSRDHRGTSLREETTRSNDFGKRLSEAVSIQLAKEKKHSEAVSAWVRENLN
jgi:hypothetical protein